MKRDLTIFIKLMSYGSYFIIALIVFIIGIGFWGFSNTHYDLVGPSVQIDHMDENDENRYIYLFFTNFSPLAG